MLMDGDDIGKWFQQQKQPGNCARLLPEQQQRLTKLERVSLMGWSVDRLCLSD
ncbi:MULTISPECIES: hypothetical protein [Streptomyces]|uniref:hypothetical protein n=1 Tax=Streptomyces TaxID=1883 RepID=UPI00367B8934